MAVAVEVAVAVAGLLAVAFCMTLGGRAAGTATAFEPCPRCKPRLAASAFGASTFSTSGTDAAMALATVAGDGASTLILRSAVTIGAHKRKTIPLEPARAIERERQPRQMQSREREATKADAVERERGRCHRGGPPSLK